MVDRAIQEKASLALSHYLEKHPLAEISCFDIAGVVLEVAEKEKAK